MLTRKRGIIERFLNLESSSRCGCWQKFFSVCGCQAGLVIHSLYALNLNKIHLVLHTHDPSVLILKEMHRISTIARRNCSSSKCNLVIFPDFLHGSVLSVSPYKQSHMITLSFPSTSRCYSIRRNAACEGKFTKKVSYITWLSNCSALGGKRKRKKMEKLKAWLLTRYYCSHFAHKSFSWTFPSFTIFF